MGDNLDGQPSGVGGEAPRGEMVEPDTVLEVSDGVLDLGVAAMVGLQFQGFPVPVGDEAVIAVVGEEGQLGTGRWLHPPDDEPRGCGVGLSLEGDGGGLHFLRAIELRVDLEEKRLVRILLVKFAEVERPVMPGKGWRAGFHEKSRLFVRLKRRLALWRDCEKVR